MFHTIHPRAAMGAVAVACAIVLAGCGGGSNASLARHSVGDGPKMVSSTPRAGGELAHNRRHVTLHFDDQLDTGAQVLVQFHDSDVIAEDPVLTNDRHGLDAVIDAEDRGTYEVSWRVCSASRKTSCSKGTFGFHAPGP